ncbi:protein-L-isoaspartate(D-aspartate) O-methyltransferase [Candidatus Aenigmatarchaeota archaeon]
MLSEKKKKLIDELVSQGYLHNKHVIAAFRKVPREDFVLPEHKKLAYANYPLPIYEDQTISQPLTVAALTEALKPKANQKIMEIGAGSGYQAAILSEIVGKKGVVIAVERLHTLSEFAKKNLKKYKNVFVIESDGTCGYEKEAPYDRIVVSASAPEVPKPLLNQLKTNGILVITIMNELFTIKKTKKGLDKKLIGNFVFVPLIGKYGYKEL